MLLGSWGSARRCAQRGETQRGETKRGEALFGGLLDVCALAVDGVVVSGRLILVVSLILVAWSWGFHVGNAAEDGCRQPRRAPPRWQAP